MRRDQAVIAQRFGYGLAPQRAAPDRPADLLAPLAGPDLMAVAYPIATLEDFAPIIAQILAARKRAREHPEDKVEALDEARALGREEWLRHIRHLGQSIARVIATEDPLRERLTYFWADHFSVMGQGGAAQWTASHYVSEAIRPNITGRFSDLLRAAILHPVMLIYLDQHLSIGPNSDVAAKRENAGLNENLARELLELHTLGVDGAYGQQDVRQLAELLAGLWANYAWDGFHGFNPRKGEPGPETVLGVSYGGEAPDLPAIHAALEDLAVHPDTARHIAGKLCTHFVSDDPPVALVDHVAARFRQTEGDLMEVYSALLEHPAALSPDLVKARQPFDFVAASLRALDVDPDHPDLHVGNKVNRWIRRPMIAMGQKWEQPRGPDGWPEEAEHWMTPQGLAVRLSWSLQLERMPFVTLPDPRTFVEAALGPLATPELVFAAGAAETRADGIAVVLASPPFQRR